VKKSQVICSALVLLSSRNQSHLSPDLAQGTLPSGNSPLKTSSEKHSDLSVPLERWSYSTGLSMVGTHNPGRWAREDCTFQAVVIWDVSNTQLTLTSSLMLQMSAGQPCV